MSKNLLVKSIQALIFIVVVAVPLVVWRWGMYPFQIAKTTLLQSLVEVAFALWLGLIILYPEFRPKRTPLFWALAALILAITASGVFGLDWQKSFWSNESRTMGIVAIWHFYALYLMLVSLRERFNWRRFFLASIFTAAVISIGSILQRFAFPHLAITDYERPSSTFGNPTFLAGYLLFNIFLAVWFLSRDYFADKKSWKKPVNILLATAILLSLTGVVLAQTIGDIAGLAVGVFVVLMFAVAKKENIKLRRAAIVFISAGIIFSGIFLITRHAEVWSQIPGLKRIAAVKLESTQVQFRWIAWKNGVNGFLDRPVLGYGWENYNLAFNKRYNPVYLTDSFGETYWDKPHNIFIEYLSTTGVLGFLAYLSVFGALIYELLKRKKQLLGDNMFRVFGLAALVAYVVQNLVAFDTTGTYLMFFILIAFVDQKYGSVAGPEIAPLNEVGASAGGAREYLPLIFMAVSFWGVYFNYNIFLASRMEWWGINYFVNARLPQSLDGFNAAMRVPTPYRDDIRKDFAGTVKQAYQQWTEYPDMNNLQKRLIAELETTIDRHPLDYFNYVALADFKNTFAEFNRAYLKDTEDLSAKALELSPRRQQIYYVVAKSKILEGDYPAAFDAFDTAVNLNVKAGDPHFFYGLLAYQVAATKKGEEMQALLQKGRSEIALAKQFGREPREAAEAIALGNFVGDLDHNYDAAAEYFFKAIEMNYGLSKDTRDAEMKLAVAYYLGGRKDRAREWFISLGKKVNYKELRIWPDLEPVLKELGVPVE